MRRAFLRTVLLATALWLPALGQAAPASRLNELLWLGSHNSYRPEPTPADLARLRTYGARTSGLEYGHPPLARQLDLGVRQLDFDIWADTGGGLYSMAHADNPAQQATMGEPGPKVMHMLKVDERTLCAALAQCLRDVAAWSQAHPKHDLILIFLSAKEAAPIPGAPKPELWTSDSLAAVDKLAIEIFGRERLLTPDDVREGKGTLREAVLAKRWPARAATRGKVLLVLDAPQRVADLYRQEHPSLRGRAMFGLYHQSEPEAAILYLPDPKKDEGSIRELVEQGFLVRTRSDAQTREARAGDYSRLDAAVRSKAQIVSTDYYPGAPDPLGIKFQLKVPTTAR